MPRTLAALLPLMLASLVVAEELKLPPVPADAPDWEATGELAELLDKMEASVAATQKVFKPLTAEQLNWQPPNGTHTPRWNAEHMVGVQLLFFSQIYAAIDPDHHTVIKINPKQMPADYEPANPSWDGEREAKRMQRVSDYVRGHAYLLADLDLDEKAPGSRWVLRALLKKMDSHYAEHTANVVKKSELPDWPRE